MTSTSATDLDDVLDGMLSQFGSPTPQAIAATSRAHPEHRAALLEFAASWAEEEWLPETGALSSDIQESLGAAARGRFAGALAARASGSARASLADLAARAGATLQDIAKASRIDADVIGKLTAGRIIPASVGRILPSRIARAIGTTAEAVLASITAGPRPLAAAFLGPALAGTTQTLHEALAEAGADDATIAELDLPA